MIIAIFFVTMHIVMLGFMIINMNEWAYEYPLSGLLAMLVNFIMLCAWSSVIVLG